MDLAYTETPPTRRPGRIWTVRVTGHSDRTASVACSSPCGMPPRSRDLAALRRFAEAHVAAHARAATVHPDAACACRQAQCSTHEGTQVHCAGTVLLVMRHDPAVGQVWTLSEVCAACAPLMTHARIVGRAVPRSRPAAAPAAATGAPEAGTGAPDVGAGAAPGAAAPVPGGFSAPPGPGFGGGDTAPVPARRRARGRRHEPAQPRRRGRRGRA
ncbi:hypothetical protein ACFV6E_04080 [Streptomyces sp. NPDC059785]|uniref:hypothetical protein n=1 Tax=Streptomyces sp. NPDC059785 TaxID=3346945 RepID=UPI0036676676